MSKKEFTRRKFIRKTLSGAAVFSAIPPMEGVSKDGLKSPSLVPTSDSLIEKIKEALPDEALYEYHKKLSNDPIHVLRRDKDAATAEGEMGIADQGWSIICHPNCSPLIRHSIDDFRDYLSISQQIDVTVQVSEDISTKKSTKQVIIAATTSHLPEFQKDLKGPKDYLISVSESQIIVCGYDDRGTMFGLYNLEARMNLREGPYLPKNLFTIRHSLYQTRMVLSWMGWMEWPDRLLSHLVHDGFDGIFAAVYTNPTGNRTTAETSTDFYARILYKARQQDPVVVRDLIDRAARFGLKVYTPIIYQYMGTDESKTGLRKLVRSILEKFPDIKGYILLTEGFWYQAWGGGHGADESYMQNWAENWCEAVRIVEEDCHRVDPSIEIIPWEYNIDFRPKNKAIKKYFIQQLPQETIPMLTWENGKSYQIDGMQCYLRDYSLNQIGPAEVTGAQIEEADRRGMQVYSKVDTFASWQFGTIPYLPCPQQWYDRYSALEKHGVAGTLESWSSGYKPNFISELRAWTCWSDAPDHKDLLGAMAARIFGQPQKEMVIQAWQHFSEAIRLVPDTGPNMGTNHAVANPLFFQEPTARTATFQFSWSDQKRYLPLNPYWPYTVSRMVFYPDFTNQVNLAEKYARRATGIEVDESVKVLPVFLKYLALAAEKVEEGLSLYRQAAQECPAHKRAGAFKEVVVAEQLQRMMQSDHAVLEFEDLRLQLMQTNDRNQASNILSSLEKILESEILRTEKSLLAAQKDSRLGFQFEQDYVYTPYSLQEKINLLKLTLAEHIPTYRQTMKNK